MNDREKSHDLKRRQWLVWTVNIALIVLVLIISLAGFQAYHRLNNMVEQLEKSAEPNYKLLLINELSFFINEMERETELYTNNSDKIHLREFDEALEQSIVLIDSLRNLYSNSTLKTRCDSLSRLVQERAKVQTQQHAISNDLLETTIDDLSQRIEQLPKTLEDTTLTDTPEKKPGLFKRIFTRKKNRQPQDTVQKPSQAELLQKEIMAELKETKAKAEKEGLQIKARLSDLEQRSQTLQGLIVQLIDDLEIAELDADRDNVRNIQELTQDTNRQIVLFSALSGTLLLITIASQLNYLMRNRRHQQALQEAKKRAEELTRAKEQFLANMSHEVRTPMNAISGFTNQLLKTELKPDQKEQLQIIKDSADHLLRILNDVLDFSKIQANKVTLDYQSMDIRQVLHDCTRLFETMAAEKGISLITEFGPLPGTVTGDAHRLRQIVMNLLSNAIKFTEEGQVKLTAEQTKTDHGQVWIKIAVKDTGIGISSENQKKIFQEFEQANVSDNSKGTGLGLAIADMLVKLFGGRIMLKSQPGQGTQLTLHLPFKPGTQESEKPDQTKPQILLQDLRILIADDEPFNLKLLQAILKNHEVEVTEYSNGKEAFEALSRTHFDVALLDLKMPEMKGWEIASAIRADKGPNQQSVLIALTATVSESEYQKSVKSGFDRVLRKPFDEEELLRLIQTSTANNKEGGQSLKKAEGNVNSPVLKIDLSKLEQMGDAAFVQDMLTTFISSAGNGIKKIQEALLNNDRETIANEAHKLLPPVRHLRIKPLLEILEALEAEAPKASLSVLEEKAGIINEMFTQIEKTISKYID